MKNKYEIRGEVTVVFLESKKYGIKEVLIDTTDLAKVQSLRTTWMCGSSNGTLYTKASISDDKVRKQYYLHRFIMNPTSDMVVDHINHDTMDNRKENLRVVTQAQNNQNKKKANTCNTNSEQVSVTRIHGRGKEWVVMFISEGKIQYYRYFKTLEEANYHAKHARAVYLPYSREALELDREESKKIISEYDKKSQGNNKHSKLKNIDWMSVRKRWRVRIQASGKSELIGYFEDFSEAEEALRLRKNIS